MRALGALAIGALLMAAPATALADRNMDANPPSGIQPTTATLADVLAQNAKAEGKQLATASRIEEWTFRAGGFDGTTREIWKGKDFKTVETRGPFSSQGGRIGGVRWQQTTNGITIIMGGVHTEDTDLEDALTEARAGKPGDAVKLLGEVTSPMTAYVVEVHPAHDPPTWLFFDKSSGLEVRSESMYGGVRGTRTYSDFQTFDGAVIATKISATDGEPADDVLTTLLTLHLNAPVASADLNIPPSRHDLVEFPEGVSAVKLPVKMPLPASMLRVMTSDFQFPPGSLRDHITVRVVINGRGLDFWLDSGASGIAIDKDIADEMGLKQYGLYGQTAEGEAGPARVVVPEMRIGALRMKNFAAFVIPFQMQGCQGRVVGSDIPERVVGLLGFDFIASVGLKVDWDKGEVVAYAPGTMPLPPTGVTVPLRLDDLVPDVDVEVSDVLSEHFILDTGASTVLIFPGFARQHQAQVRDQGMGTAIQRFLPDLCISVVGGTATVYLVQLKRLNFGTVFNEFMVDVVDPNAPFQFQDVDGLVGYSVLHYFNLYFDYENSRIVLEPDIDFQRATHTPKRP